VANASVVSRVEVVFISERWMLRSCGLRWGATK
jgi:hypothetical protein